MGQDYYPEQSYMDTLATAVGTVPPAFNLHSMREELCELINIARDTRLELEGKLNAIQGGSSLNQLAGMVGDGLKSPTEPTIQARFQELRGEILLLSKASGRL